MPEDLREEANPAADEAGWMAIDAVAVVVKSVALAAVALTVGFAAAVVLDRMDRAPAMVISDPGPR